MIVPFVLTGLLLTAVALLWARYKQNQNDSGPTSPPEPDVAESGGEG